MVGSRLDDLDFKLRIFLFKEIEICFEIWIVRSQSIEQEGYLLYEESLGKGQDNKK
jgi:hypothetical protein